MTTSTATAATAAGPVTAGHRRLVRAELLKIRTTNAWWWFALGALAWTLVALGFNMWLAHTAFTNPEVLSGEAGPGLTSTVFHGSNVYTSGQYLGLMFVMLIGILMVTNEFHHQTATATFLATPRRTVVIASKLVAGVLVAMAFALAIMAVAVPAGAVFFGAEDVGTLLDEWPIQRSLLLNLLAFGVWSVFGVGIGTLITNQLFATLLAAGLYLVGTELGNVFFLLLSSWLDNEAVQEWRVIIPSVASQVMTSGGADIPGSPEWWVGALILLGYAVVAGTIGVLITRRRDIS